MTMTSSSSSSSIIMVVSDTASIVVAGGIPMELSVASSSTSPSLAASWVFLASSSVSLIRSRIRA